MLLAAEREPDRFYGFWTDDAGVVDDVLARSAALADAASGPPSPSTA